MKRNILNENRIIITVALVFAAAMVAFPAVTETGSKSAISIWLNSIVPVLLPFFIFADFIKRTADMTRIPVRAYPVVMAFLSGYPMGAKIVGDLVKDGILSIREGENVISYSLVTGPAFILGTIGAFLGNTRAAAFVAIAHYLGAACNGLMWRSGLEHQNIKICRPHRTIVSGQSKNNNILDNFTDAILAGFRAMAIILAYLILFMIAAELLEITGVFGILHGQEWQAAAKGLMEMTIGANHIGMCNISMGFKVVLVSFIISFGGLSVIGQSVSVAAGSGLTLKTILKVKMTHGLFAGVIAAIMIFLESTVFS